MDDNVAIGAVDDADLAAAIGQAERRVVVVAPAVEEATAAALAERWRALGADAVTVVVDVDAEVYRLGYGSLVALRALDEAAAEVGGLVTKQPGVRVGVVIVDERCVVYAPTPKLIEAGPRAANAANGVYVGLAPAELERQLGLGPDGGRERTIGMDGAERREVKDVADDLAANPPLKFDVARHVRVFNAYLEFVDFRLSNALLDRRIVPLPTDLLGIKDADARRKLRATFRLIEPDDELSGQHLMEDRKRIASHYLRHIDGYGAAIKRTDKDAFLAEVKQLDAAVTAFRAKVIAGLSATLERNRAALVKALLPMVRRKPPKAWAESCLFNASDKDAARRFLEQELDRAFGRAERLVTPMKVTTLFKGVTYEMLRDERFMAAARKAFPELPALHEEADAAKAAPATPPATRPHPTKDAA